MKKTLTLSVRERSQPGHLFDLKSTCTRSKLKCLKLSNLKEINYLFEPMDGLKLNLLNFHSIEKLYNNGYIKTLDNGCLISDKLFLIGENELFK